MPYVGDGFIDNLDLLSWNVVVKRGSLDRLTIACRYTSDNLVAVLKIIVIKEAPLFPFVSSSQYTFTCKKNRNFRTLI